MDRRQRRQAGEQRGCGDNIDVCYAPFQFVNPLACGVIVGITPGRTQMLNALKEACLQLDRGTDTLDTLMAAKRTGAFSGTMRPNLVGLLDCVGLNRWLDIRTCDELFGSASVLLQTVSVLRNPVVINGQNYNRTPNMICHPMLREQHRKQTRVLQEMSREERSDRWR